MDFLDATDAPITVILGPEKTEVQFPVLATEDIMATLSRLRADRMAKLRQACKDFAVPANEAAYLVWQQETAPLSPHDAHQHYMNMPGHDEVLVTSLGKRGVPEEAAKKIIHRLVIDDRRTLALRVAHIFHPKAPEAPAATTPAKAKEQTLQEKAASVQGFGEQPANPPAADRGE